MGMFDDLIPQTPAAPVVKPAGMFDDLIPTQPAIAPAPQPDVVPGGNGEPTRITVRPEAPQRTALQSVREAIDPANAVSFIAGLPSNHSFRVGAQGVGAGVRDAVLGPADLVTSLTNAATSGVNSLFGTEIPQAMPLSRIADKVTAPFAIPENEMSPQERLGYNINRFGTQGLGLGATLAARAPAVAEAATVAPTIGGRLLDTLSRPYAAAPSKTVLGDTIAGAGAGVGVNAAQEYVPKEPVTTFGKVAKGVADFAAPLAGAIGASGLQHAVEGLGGVLRRAAQSRTDVNVPVSPTTGTPHSVAQTNAAAQQLQDQATGPSRALAQDIRENAYELTNPTRPGEVPVEPSQLPTTGLLSRDPGLVRAETTSRTKDTGEYVQRDQNVKEAAAQRVDSLRDPNADQGAVQKFMKEEPKRLAEERDAEALPLLRQAEQSGVAVDARPVAALIDDKLATAKRPPVRAALTEARKQLNKVGSDELDNSVSGLYEARKAINDIIEGRGENATGRFAQRELIEVRNALDDSIGTASPEFGQYLQKYREGSEPVNAFTESPTVQSVANAKNNDVRNTVKSILSNGTYGGEKQAEEIGKLIAQNPSAKDGWKAAVADVLSDKITSTRRTGETYEVQYARLAKEFKDNEAVLAKTFSPEEMNNLRQAHKLLEYFKEAEKRPTNGSPTAERSVLWRSGELVLRHIYGDLKGGGIIRRMKLLADVLPSNKSAVEEITNMAWFNPEVAAYLLEKKLPDQNVYHVNVNLRRLIAADNAARGGD